MLRRLHAPPYDAIREATLAEILAQYWHVILVVLVALIAMGGVTVFVLRLNQRLGESNTALGREIQQRKQMEHQLLISEKMSSLGQMAAGITCDRDRIAGSEIAALAELAHELAPRTHTNYRWIRSAGYDRSVSAGTRDLPQANSLAKVRELVAALAGGRDRSLIEAGGSIGLSPRHSRYYGVAASATLAFFAIEGDRVRVTALGRDLLATEPRSYAERMIFRRAIVDSPSVVSIAHDLLDPEGPTAQALTQRLIHAGLSPATARRRASTLLSWRRYVLERQMSLPLAHDGERVRRAKRERARRG